LARAEVPAKALARRRRIGGEGVSAPEVAEVGGMMAATSITVRLPLTTRQW
jgi:hypothetical protein